MQRASSPLYPMLLLIILPFCDDVGDDRYRSVLRCPCRLQARNVAPQQGKLVARRLSKNALLQIRSTCNVTRRCTERTVLLTNNYMERSSWLLESLNLLRHSHHPFSVLYNYFDNPI